MSKMSKQLPKKVKFFNFQIFQIQISNFGNVLSFEGQNFNLELYMYSLGNFPRIHDNCKVKKNNYELIESALKNSYC